MNIKDFSTKFFGTNKPLSMYLNEIRRYKVPTVEEEEKLLERLENGDESAKTELIVRNQRFIYAMAKRYAKSEDDVLEYVDEGNIGLMKAFKDYKPEKGYRFLTFAVWYVQREMNYYLNNTNNMVIRSNNMKLAKKIDNVKNVFFNENGMMPTENQIIELVKEKFNIDIKDISDVYDVNVSSISDELDDDFTVEENSEYNDKTASRNAYEDDVDREYAVKTVNKLLNILPEDKKEMVKMLYGIGYERVYTIDEVGEKYDMYPEDVTKITNTVLRYLKQELKYKVAV